MFKKILYITIVVFVLSFLFMAHNAIKSYKNLSSEIESELLCEVPEVRGMEIRGNSHPIASNFPDVREREKPAAIEDSATMAKILPHYEATSGKFSGFRIDNIKKGSIIERAGLHNGDIIKVVNGQPLTSPQRAIQVFRKVRNQSQIELCLLREDRIVRLNYNVSSLKD